MDSDVAKIPLPNELWAVIDIADLPLVAPHTWHVRLTHSGPYAYSNNNLAMHRLIASPREGEIIDHRDGDTLNNRRSNLRAASYQQNARNSKKRGANTTSGFKGVFLHGLSKTNPWTARLKAGGKNHYLGVFPSEHEAARAYDQAAKTYFGEFANLNFKE